MGYGIPQKWIVHKERVTNSVKKEGYKMVFPVAY